MVIAATESEVSDLIAKYRSAGLNDEELENLAIYGTPDQVSAKIQERVKAGVQYQIINFRGPNEMDALKLFAEEVMPQFK